jgi:Flp pilus assembly protein TadB
MTLTTEILRWLWPLLAGLGVLAALAAVLAPTSPRKPRRPPPHRDRIPGRPGASLAYGLAGRLRHAPARISEIEQRLRAANWFWAPGEPSPPDAAAPFTSARGFRAAQVWYALAGAVGGFLLGALLALATTSTPLTALALAGVGGALGYGQPGKRLRRAVRVRHHRMLVEMAFRLPELAALVSTGRSTLKALELLTARPGGPFTTEMVRLLRRYRVNRALPDALRAVIRHNRFPPLSEFLRQVLLVEQQGGSLAPALHVQAAAAQDKLRRHLLERGQRNTGMMRMPVQLSTVVVIMLLIAAPTLSYVLTYL